MTFVALVLAAGVLCLPVRGPLYLSVFGLLLASPIVSYGLRAVCGAAGPGTGRWPDFAGFVCAGGLLYVAAGARRTREPYGVSPVVVFVAVFCLCLGLSLGWPDFYPVGERMRDFALLGSVIHDPGGAAEPWMSGAGLNYYLYWYRFGAWSAAVTGGDVASTYHRLAAFAPAFLAASLFAIASRTLGHGPVASSVMTAGVVFGSNVAGLAARMSGSDDWWAPSRVVKGAINEFPAWSFVLGDVHPHYLNLGIVPFFVALHAELLGSRLPRRLKWGAVAALAAPCTLLVYNANAWELPLWASLWAIGAGLCLAPGLKADAGASRGVDPAPRDGRGAEAAGGRPGRMSLRWGVPALVLAASLYASSRNIVPGGAPGRLVPGDVPGTTLLEAAGHFGLPLSVSMVAIPLVQATPAVGAAAAVVLALLLLASAAEGEAYPLLLGLTAGAACAVIRRKPGVGALPVALLAASLTWVLLPEFVFLDDAYGGENERMNTIFKAYSAAWSPLMLAAFHFAVLGASSRTGRRLLLPSRPLGAAAVCLLLAWTAHAVSLRRSAAPSPDPDGLDAVERTFPGARATVLALRGAPHGVVLEAQGDAYGWTSHVCTLSGHPCYLGWANHVGLLTGRHDEVARRTAVTADVYGSAGCDAARETLAREGITYVVVGPLETDRYSGAARLSHCLRRVSSAGRYDVLAARPQ